MGSGSKPPKTYDAFRARYPHIGEAWDKLRDEEAAGPLDEKIGRLVKLGIAIGSMKEGAVHSAVRKARSAGASREEMEHVVALAASTIGLPSTVAVFSWLRDELDD